MDIVLTIDTVLYSKYFKKDIQKLSPEERGIVQSKLGILFRSPELQNIKHLKQYPGGGYRLRLGHYRILFSWDDEAQKFIFLRIKNRRDLY